VGTAAEHEFGSDYVTMSPSPAVTLIDRPHTHNSRYPRRPLGLHQETTHSKILFFGRRPLRWLVHPRRRVRNTLRTIQTDAAL